MTIDCGRLRRQSRRRRRARRRAGFAARRAEAASRGRLRGLGIACFLETSRGAPGERAEIRFEPRRRGRRWCSARNRTARGTRPLIRRSPPTCSALPMQRVPLCPGRHARGARAATAMAARARCIWAARRWSGGAEVIAKGAADRRASAAGRRAEIGFARGRFTRAGTERGIDLLAVAQRRADPANLPDGMALGSTPRLQHDWTSSPSRTAVMSPRSRSIPRPAS